MSNKPTHYLLIVLSNRKRKIEKIFSNMLVVYYYMEIGADALMPGCPIQTIQNPSMTFQLLFPVNRKQFMLNNRKLCLKIHFVNEVRVVA